MAEPEIVRWKVEPLRPRDRRTWDCWMIAATPRWLRRRIATRFLNLRKGSRLRRAFLTRFCRVGWEANRRRDWKVLLAMFDPDFELTVDPDPELSAAFALEPEYRGHEGMQRFIESWAEPFEQSWWEPREVLDCGGRAFGFLLEWCAIGRGSSIEVREREAATFSVENGLISRQRGWRGPASWENAERALREELG